MTAEQFMGLTVPTALHLIATAHPIAERCEENISAYFLQVENVYVKVTVNNYDLSSYGYQAFTAQDARYGVMLEWMRENGGSALLKTA